MKDKKEMIMNILNKYGCSNTFQIKGLIYRTYGEILSERSIAGQMRVLTAKGIVSKGFDANRKAIYWLTPYGKESMNV